MRRTFIQNGKQTDYSRKHGRHLTTKNSTYLIAVNKNMFNISNQNLLNRSPDDSCRTEIILLVNKLKILDTHI